MKLSSDDYAANFKQHNSKKLKCVSNNENLLIDDVILALANLANKVGFFKSVSSRS